MALYFSFLGEYSLTLLEKEKFDAIKTRLNETNYRGWAFHLKHYVEAQGLGKYFDGTTNPATNEKGKSADGKEQSECAQNNSKVIS